MQIGEGGRFQFNYAYLMWGGGEFQNAVVDDMLNGERGE